MVKGWKGEGKRHSEVQKKGRSIVVKKFQEPLKKWDEVKIKGTHYDGKTGVIMDLLPNNIINVEFANGEGNNFDLENVKKESRQGKYDMSISENKDWQSFGRSASGHSGEDAIEQTTKWLSKHYRNPNWDLILKKKLMIEYMFSKDEAEGTVIYASGEDGVDLGNTPFSG